LAAISQPLPQKQSTNKLLAIIAPMKKEINFTVYSSYQLQTSTSFGEAKLKVENAINNISINYGISLDNAINKKR